MDRHQWIATGSAAALLFALFLFGRTKPLPKGDVGAAEGRPASESLDIEAVMDTLRNRLTPGQSARITTLENTITRGDLATQRVQAYGQLAAYWRDSVGEYLPYLWYTGEKAKLEKSEKSLTFAGHSYLEELRGTADPEVKSWMASEARKLFQEALKLDPDDDSTKVGLGSTYFFGTEQGSSPMQGIQGIREVADRDTANTFAQFMLGYGGMLSGQFDKAEERLLRVVRLQPGNREAIFLLAECYERMGRKEEAVAWFEKGKAMVDNPDVIRAIDEKIKSLK